VEPPSWSQESNSRPLGPPVQVQNPDSVLWTFPVSSSRASGGEEKGPNVLELQHLGRRCKRFNSQDPSNDCRESLEETDGRNLDEASE
jgi:hypothetical protein